ncbi:SGNH/GDSL hydrolase family protein [Treponema bryantii]|uniref:SGNH/GDSL hydrolase family protein n=1 Tax=Treponema bryantii TaxID=163 RepID=UPI002B324820|nr:acetylxylan esterase [Treponema bryantii]
MKNYLMNEIKNMRVQGRNVPGGVCADGSVQLFWAGSALELCVKAREVWAEISSDYDFHEIWLAVEVNGYQIARFAAPKEPSLICLAHNLDPEKENTISILKDTQPMPGDNKHSLKISSVSLDDNGVFVAPKPHSCKIEFIGDSITSGEGLAGKPDEMDWITQWFCGSKTYAVQTAKMLDADWMSISESGWGICWGWDGDVNSRIPLYYKQVCGVLGGDAQKASGTCNVLDFEGGSDYVVLNLGSNDNLGFKVHDDGKGIEGVAGIALVSEVKRFLGEIRQNNPRAKIIWTWGMLSLDIVPALISKGVEEYKSESGDKAVYTLELESIDALEKCDEDKGSRGHPGPITHKKAAQRIVDFIRGLN